MTSGKRSEAETGKTTKRSRNKLKKPDSSGLINEEMLASFGLHELVPEPLAAWRPLVSDGLAFFLERLPAERLMAIVADQLMLPASADASKRLVTLLAHCPTLHKLGQVIARYPGLHPELRRQLQTLESMPSTTPIRQVLDCIRAELPANLPITVANEALAEGSVAVVVPFTYPENGEIHHGVFKVLKPGIEEKLNAELVILVEVAPFLEARSKQLGLPPIDYQDTLNTVRRLMVKEVHLEVEQKNLQAAAAFYAEEPLILVPRLLPWCTPRMTAMERVFGSKVTDPDLSQKLRQELADTMISALLGQPFWSKSEFAVVHADLHAGNLFVTEDGRLAVLDWSLTASLSKAQREALVAIALGGMMLDASKIRHAVATLGTMTHDDPILAEAVDRALDRLVMQGQVPGFSWLLELLDDLAFHTVTGFWEDFVLLRKSWLSLSGVIDDMVKELSPDKQLTGLALKRLLREMPARSIAFPDSMNFATHMSNADILRLLSSPWLISMRYWGRCLNHGMSLLGSVGQPIDPGRIAPRSA